MKGEQEMPRMRDSVSDLFLSLFLIKNVKELILFLYIILFLIISIIQSKNNVNGFCDKVKIHEGQLCGIFR